VNRLMIRVLATLPVLLVFLPFQASPGEGGMPRPFRMRVVDGHGEGIPGVRVVSDNGIVCHTRADGSIHWTERSLMDRDVRFRIEAAGGVRTTATYHVTSDGRTEIALPNKSASVDRPQRQ
jgi:hypothetical protein